MMVMSLNLQINYWKTNRTILEITFWQQKSYLVLDNLFLMIILSSILLNGTATFKNI
jgi:hypothetical protein